MSVSVSDGHLHVVGSVRPRLLASHVGDEEYDAEHYAEGTNDDVADCEEVVGTAKNVSGREHEVLAASKGAHIIVVLDIKVVRSLLEVVLDLAVKFTEVR